METAVLRVKRKRGAEPAGALLIHCKRPRPAGAETPGKEEEDTPGASAVRTQLFRLAATVSSQREPLHQYVQEAIARGLRTPIGNLPQIQEGLRASREAERQASRYRLVSSLRPKCEEDEKSDSGQPSGPAEEQGPQTAATQEGAEGRKHGCLQVLDIEQEETERGDDEPKACDPETIMCNSMKMIRERLVVSEDGPGSGHRDHPEEFVYDIYYSQSPPSAWIQDVLSVQPYNCEPALMADDDDEANEVYEDEDDENEENNWRNDYPDEDDEENSDREERYRGYYEDSDEECGRDHSWEDYCLRAGE